MRFVPKNSIKKFQMGGPMESAAPEETAAPAELGGQQDPMMMLAEAAMLALQNQDCQMAMLVCLGFVQLIQQATAGGQEAQGEPVFRKGGTLLRRIKK